MVPHIWHLNLNAYCEGSQRENNCKRDNLKSKRHTLIKHTWLRNSNAFIHRDYNTPEIVFWTNICISMKLHYLSSSGVTHGFVTLLWWWSLQFLMNPTAVTQGFCFITPCRSNHAGFLMVMARSRTAPGPIRWGFAIGVRPIMHHHCKTYHQ